MFFTKQFMHRCWMKLPIICDFQKITSWTSSQTSPVMWHLLNVTFDKIQIFEFECEKNAKKLKLLPNFQWISSIQYNNSIHSPWIISMWIFFNQFFFSYLPNFLLYAYFLMRNFLLLYLMLWKPLKLLTTTFGSTLLRIIYDWQPAWKKRVWTKEWKWKIGKIHLKFYREVVVHSSHSARLDNVKQKTMLNRGKPHSIPFQWRFDMSVFFFLFGFPTAFIVSTNR